MRKIKFTTLKVQNFLSVGNDTLVIDFQNGLNLITGIDIDNPERRNGAGKCVDENTAIDIEIPDAMAMERFKKMFGYD